VAGITTSLLKLFENTSFELRCLMCVLFYGNVYWQKFYLVGVGCVREVYLGYVLPEDWMFAEHQPAENNDND